MVYSKFLLLFSVFIFFLCLATSFSFSVNATRKCSQEQSDALLLFKENLSLIDDPAYDSPCQDWLGSGYYPIMMNWNTSTDCCDWNGVTCDHSSGDVIGLDLTCGMLKGTIHPNISLFNLPRLQRLALAFNDFRGSQLPRAIGNFSSTLTHLDISGCGFTGEIPSEITHLRKLVSLDLSQNPIDFKLDSHIFINLLQNFTFLKELSLQDVNISSVLPTHINISSLILLNLRSTSLRGKPPRNLFDIKSLEKLDLSKNMFTGHIPWEISLLPKLVMLDLSTNRFDLHPSTLNNLLSNSTNLTDLWLAQVNIGWVLPTCLNISSSLKSLDLRSTSLKGKLPDNIFNLNYLEELDLSGNNNLIGPFPRVNTSTSIPLKWLDLSFANLSGNIPVSLGHLKSLDTLRLSSCCLMGSIPKSLVNLKYLTFLYLSSNNLNGTLPSWLFTLPSLEYIRLDTNRFGGNIPLELFSLQSIIGLSLARNQLAGQIDVLDHGPNPQTFQKLTNLTYLDLSSNKFRGDWDLDLLLSSLPKLEELYLSDSGLSVTTNNANQFVNPGFVYLSLGSCKLKVFPEFIRAMKNLKSLDLSDNDIHGHIPDWIGEIGKNGLLVLDLQNNSINGTIPNVYEEYGMLEGFILNGNQLEGEVPASLSKCQNLKILDLGNNHLNDTFPRWLGDLPNLKALVLKSNNFHGPIVTSSITESPFLSLRVLDLSHNGFVGQLPAIYFQNFKAMKNVIKKRTQPEYLLVGRIYYSIIVSMKGVDQVFPKLFVDYTIVDLSNNKFERDIPDIIGSLESLIVLDLSHNSLTGRIPHALGKLSEIESLDLSSNQLKGEIPQSLADISTLAVLNLSQNNLVGRIPPGKQFNTFDETSFGGNSGLCGFPLSKECEHVNSPVVESNKDDDDNDDGMSGFTWRVVMLGYGCGTLLGLLMGCIMLSTGRPKWFNEIADAAEHMMLKKRNKRSYIYIGK